MRKFVYMFHWLKNIVFSGRRVVSGDLCKCISFFLREPLRAVISILRRNVLFLQQVEHRRVHVLDRYRMRQYAASFELRQGNKFSDLTEMDGRSRILATYHFGDFVYGMNYLVCLDPPGRNRLVLSHAMPSPNYAENMHHAFGAKAVGETAQLISADTSTAALSALLRQGDCTLVMFCDLPSGSGELVQIKFLNRTAWFPRGPATLAITNRTPLLPVINYLYEGINKIELAQQIEPDLLAGESLETGVRRITQLLINFFEQYFLRFPEQWRYLRHLPLYFVEEKAESGLS
ncbi:MAG: hypothetical protein IIB77_08335 [Proteobacteria bacterium]|nr:hypothetical protein [Pseudomonadota bacterium]